MSITLYSTTTCRPCRLVARKLDTNGVPFQKIDLDLPEHAETLETLKRSLNTNTIHTPTIIENGVVAMVGLDPDALNGLIAKHGKNAA